MPDWQKDLARRLLEEGRIVLHPAQGSGKREAILHAAAMAETNLERWEVVGPAEACRTLRRQARELAAHWGEECL